VGGHLARVEVVRSYSLHPAQQEVFDSKARFRVLAAGRRFGKSRLGVLEAIEVGLRGGRAWWVAPTYKLAQEGWRPLRNLARRWPGVRVLEVDKEVDLPNGGLIQVRSADDPAALRGAGLDFVVIDEAAFLSEEAWTEALRPAWLTVRVGRCSFRRRRATTGSAPCGNKRRSGKDGHGSSTHPQRTRSSTLPR